MKRNVKIIYFGPRLQDLVKFEISTHFIWAGWGNYSCRINCSLGSAKNGIGGCRDSTPRDLAGNIGRILRLSFLLLFALSFRNPSKKSPLFSPFSEISVTFLRSIRRIYVNSFW